MSFVKTKKQAEIGELAWSLYFKIILFGISMLVFISITVAFIYMAISKYEIEYVITAGGSDSLFAIVVFQITRSLFNTNN